jgi:hypothetical protein
MVKRIIHWEILDIPDDYLIYKNQINHQFAMALQVWSTWIMLDFLRIEESFDHEVVNIIRDNEDYLLVRFGKNVHNCIETFDGKGGILAHGTFSESEDFDTSKKISVEIHFDAAEKWIFEDFSPLFPKLNGHYFYIVAIHEIGHNLGLNHSDNIDSIMYADYSVYNYKLSCEDIRLAQNLHGIRNSTDCIVEQHFHDRKQMEDLSGSILFNMLLLGSMYYIFKTIKMSIN